MTKYASSTKQLAKRFDWSVGTIKTYLREGAPKKGPHGYDFAQWARWLRENKTGGSDVVSEAGLKRRKLAAQCDRIEFENQVAKGKYIESAKVERDIEQMVHAAKNVLYSLPAALGAMFGTDAEKLALAKINAALGELSRRPL